MLTHLIKRNLNNKKEMRGTEKQSRPPLPGAESGKNTGSAYPLWPRQGRDVAGHVLRCGHKKVARLGEMTQRTRMLWGKAKA